MSIDNIDILDNFDDFWPVYLREHNKRATRLCHVLGTLAALLLALKAIFFLKPLYLILAPFIGYGAAWSAHKWIQRNSPTTMHYPAWSLRADFKMAYLWVTGELETELLEQNILI